MLFRSNVDLTNEMLHMIQAQQAYNGNARALQTSSEMLRSAIETLAISSADKLSRGLAMEPWR